MSGTDREKRGSQEGVEFSSSFEDASHEGANSPEIAGPTEVDEEERIEKVRDGIEQTGQTTKSTDNFNIELTGEQRSEVEEKLKEIIKKDRFKTPSMVNGNETATEYDSEITNYSTQTHIVELSDGTKLFAIHNYRSSGIHREMDSLMKRLTGCKMRKSKRKEWKSDFEAKSLIPTIPCDDPDIVIVPYIPNINLQDLFTRSGEMEDVGECEFAKEVDSDKLLEILKKVVAKVSELHAISETWGELILDNCIIDKDEEIHICDPETAYDLDVSLDEQKARDLYDLIRSSSGVMKNRHDIPYEDLVSTILDEYDNEVVILELQSLCERNTAVLEKIFFGYTKARLHLDSVKQMEEIKKAVAGYKRDFAINK